MAEQKQQAKDTTADTDLHGDADQDAPSDTDEKRAAAEGIDVALYREMKAKGWR